MQEEKIIITENTVSQLNIFLRAFFSFGFGLCVMYFLTWGVIATSLNDWGAGAYFGACTLLSGIGSAVFGYRYKKSDVFLPRYHSMFFYSLMGILSLLTGALLLFHIESFESLPERVKLPAQILQIGVYSVLFVYCIIRLSEARFLPSLNPGRDTGEVWK